MSAYFSRLAQRSGVASTVANVRHGSSSGNAAPDWSEQSVETTAPVNALTSNSESSTSASAIENKSIHSNDNSPLSPTSQSINTLSKPNSALQHQHTFDGVNARVNSSLLSNTLSTGSSFIEHDVSHDTLNAETSLSLSMPNERGSKSDPIAASAKHASVTFDQPVAIKSSSKESFAEDKALSNALGTAPAQATEHTPVKVNSIKSTPPDIEIEIENTGKRDAHTSLVTPARAVQSRPVDVGAERIKNIASAPVQTPGLALQTPRAAPRASIEVHIGKIELEIFSPTKRPAAAADAVPMVAPRATQAAAFNPHRHYLRSR